MNKSILILCFALLGGGVIGAFAQSEEITITTYYPSPYGAYNEMTVADRMAIGDVNGDGSVDANDLAIDPNDPFGGPLDDSLTVAGSVGIGTSAPTRHLQIVGQSAVGVALGGTIQTQTSAGSNLGPSLELWHDGEAGGRRFIILSTGSNNIGGVGLFQIADQTTTDQARLSIDASGNVGIGTTNSQRRLHVSSNVADIARFEGNSAKPGYLDITNIDEGGIRLSTDGTGPIRFRPKSLVGADQVTFLENGNVGIGISAPTAKLHVIGKAIITGGVDPPYISFSNESHESIRQFAKNVEEHEKVMQFWNANANRMEIYVIEEDRFYTITGELIEE